MDRPIINSISLFSGVGMLDCGIALGLEHLGFAHRTVCFCEREAFAISQLIALQEAGCLDVAPIWTDVRTFPGKQFRGMVDLIHGGFPCQPHSVAGKRAGMQDERWLWDDIVRVISEVEPSIVFLENVPGLIHTGGLAACLGSLTEIGFDAEWGTLRASDVGASHQRERIFIMAVRQGRGLGILRESSGSGEFVDGGDGDMGNAEITGRQARRSVSGGGAARRAGVMAHGIELDDPTRHERNRPHGESGSRRGVCETGGAVGNATGEGREISGQPGQPKLCTQIGGGLDYRFEQPSRSMADAMRAGLQGRQRRERTDASGWGGAHGSISECCGLFAPGPSDPRWGEIISRFPWLASGILPDFDVRACEVELGRALRCCVVGINRRARRIAARELAARLAPMFAEAAPKPGLRELANGEFTYVDQSRRHQLRAVGNGVVPICVATAFATLARRLK